MKCQKSGCKDNNAEPARLGGWCTVVICTTHGLAWDDDEEARRMAHEESLLRIEVDANVSVGRVDEAKDAARKLYEFQGKAKAFVKSWLTVPMLPAPLPRLAKNADS